ncbi:LOW QUALITY PROTEIN: uncharacterized protein MICPUCDRAFT_65834 [Micromonas pusilla CCMP1545]|uniref:Predicted protein n=1 Tax=Micromonas pusilla (strain CCMP1545) TaxID=564608 RepID=C1N700_MICPC|nr:LOW QUALITY PROTEIN: uncharacterized protein MICPUCDRAFT_65834 [Micromonas pusilla CCMP1545]EEH52192.1 predicted protein [Micromonas pusilla CCMP1545]|eukprot:XP_003063819.1 predicted protein [Micromonas pusilla CCMP1545]
MRSLQRRPVHVVRLLQRRRLHSNLVQDGRAVRALFHDRLRGGGGQRRGLLLEQTGRVFFRLRGGFLRSSLRVFARSRQLCGQRRDSPLRFFNLGRESLDLFAACSAATACSVRAPRSTTQLASSSAWYTMALYVPDHSLSSCERTRECVRRRARGREFRLKTREERTIPEEEAEEEKNVVRRFRRRRRRRPAATRPALRSRAKLSNARPRGRFVLAV